MAFDTVDLKLMRIFVAIVDAGGFSAAQGELDLSLSTICSHMSSLEKRLRVVLCHRGRSGFQLTAEGQVIYELVKNMLATVEQLDQQIRNVRDQLHGQISIGLTDNTITDRSSRLEGAFIQMTDEAPGIVFSVMTKPPHELLRALVGGQINLAVASFPRATTSLKYIDLYEETQHFYCGARHPFYERSDDQIGIEEIQKENLVSRSYWGSRDMKIFPLARARAIVSDMEAEARFILTGRYLGYLPEHYAGEFVKSGLMRAIKPGLFSYKAPFQLAYDPAQLKTGITAYAIRTIAKQFGVKNAVTDTIAKPSATGAFSH